MKHFVMILIGAVLLYGGWQLTSPLTRKHASKTIARHALRLIAFGMLLLTLLIIAYYTPALHLL